MNSLAITGFFSVGLSFLLSLLFLAFFIMQQIVYDKKEYSYLFLFFFLLGSTISALGQNMLYISTNSVAHSLLWEKIQHIGLFILYPFWLHFVFYYFYKKKYNFPIILAYTVSLWSIIFTINSNLLFIDKPTLFKNFYTFAFGPLYSPVVAILFISILYVFILMLIDFKRNSQDRQYKLLLIIASGATMLTGLKDLLETWIKTNIPQLFPYGLIFTGLALFISVTLRYREMQKKIERRKEIEKEANLAQQIQSRFIPHDIVYAKNNFYEFTAFSKPALHLNGDFYYKIDLLPQKSLFIIGDITGHGISASLYMSLILSFLEIIKNINIFQNLPAIADTINKILFKHAHLDSTFATVIICEINFKQKKISYINAGHANSLFFNKETSQFISLKATNSPIGLNYNEIYVPQSFTYNSGDNLFLYTDGLTEQINSKNQAFGTKFLSQNLVNLNFSFISQILKQKLTNFAGKKDLDDDVTFLGLKLL